MFPQIYKRIDGVGICHVAEEKNLCTRPEGLKRALT